MRLAKHFSLAIAIGAVLGKLGLAQGAAQPKADSVRGQTPAAADTQLQNALSHAQKERGLTPLMPRFDQFRFGDRIVPAGTTVPSSVAIARGNLDLYGTVDGDAVTLDGDIHLHPGAKVTGDAIAIAGRVIVDGGVVQGEMRSLAGGAAATGTTIQIGHKRTTWESIKLAIGWFAILAILGIGVMIFSERNLDGVAVALEQGFGRSFWIGLAGQLLILPVLLLLVSALAITVIGILLIPFAIVAYVVAAAGFLALGFLAVARIVGAALSYDTNSSSPRGFNVRALLGGLVLFAFLWVVAAAFSWNPLAGGALRAIAIAVTWVAATLGLGGALVSRAGTQRESMVGDSLTTGDYLAWQTPTPVAGVSAARRARQ